MPPIDSSMIAPCGMDCELCYAHQRNKKRCAGCNGDDATKPVHCVKCAIKNCAAVKGGRSGLCFECETFPCRRLKQLDARYRQKYLMSMIENHEYIKQFGMQAFMQREDERWSCKECGTLICVHDGICLKCKSPYKE